MTSRRQFLSASAGLAAVAALPRPLRAATEGMQMRAIPSSGERLPVIGLGTSGNFEVPEGSEAYGLLGDVLSNFFDGGGRLIDTAPSYSTAHRALGALLSPAQQSQVFLATKLSGATGREAGLAQFNDSLKALRRERVDLLQVHNLHDWQTQLALARELKAEGKVRYVGLTHYTATAHDQLADIVQAEKPDFLQVNYSVTAAGAESRVLPMARDLGVAVLANRNFDDGRLFSRVAGKAVPAWATDVGATTWAQLFLKFALSHPAVTVVIPATGKPARQVENLQAGIGPMLDEKQRAMLRAAID